MDPQAVNARDAGVALVSRINRWMIAAALGLTGVVSVAAAKSFHGHARAQARAPAQPTSRGFAPSSRPGGPGLQPPAQAPGPAPASEGPAVSGGS